MNAETKVGWREAAQLIPANVRIGLVVVPLFAVGYATLVLVRQEFDVDPVIITALAVGAVYLVACLLRSYILVRRGVLIGVEQLKFTRPADSALSHLVQADYSYRYQGTVRFARELLTSIPHSLRAEPQYAIVDPRNPERATLLIMNK